MPKFTLVNADLTLQVYTLLDVLVLGRNRNWGLRWLKDGALLSKCSSFLAQTPERNCKNYQPQPDTKGCVDYCKAKLNFKDIWLNHHWVSRASASCRRMDKLNQWFSDLSGHLNTLQLSLPDQSMVEPRPGISNSPQGMLMLVLRPHFKKPWLRHMSENTDSRQTHPNSGLSWASEPWVGICCMAVVIATVFFPGRLRRVPLESTWEYHHKNKLKSILLLPNSQNHLKNKHNK